MAYKLGLIARTVATKESNFHKGSIEYYILLLHKNATYSFSVI